MLNGLVFLKTADLFSLFMVSSQTIVFTLCMYSRFIKKVVMYFLNFYLDSYLRKWYVQTANFLYRCPDHCTLLITAQGRPANSSLFLSLIQINFLHY